MALIVMLLAFLSSSCASTQNRAQAQKNAAQGYIAAGDSLSEKGRYKEALLEYGRAVKEEPSNPSAQLGRCRTLYYLDKPQDALAAIEKTISLEPEVSDLYLLKAMILGKLERYEDTIRACDDGIRLDPEDPRFYLRKGDALNWLGRFREAAVEYDKAVEAHRTARRTASALVDQGQYGDAAGVLSSPKADDANVVMAYLGKGNALDNLGRYEDARKAYDEAVRLNPGFVPAYNNTGVVLANLGLYDDALRAYNKSMELDPKSPGAYCGRGYVLVYMGRYDEAARDEEKAVALGGGKVSLVNLALALLKRNKGGDAARARGVLLEVLEDDHDGEYSDYACALLGDRDGMLRAMRRQLELKPYLKRLYRKDIEFEPYRADPEFKVLVGE